MKAVDATRILLTRKKTTAKLRKQCARARETVRCSPTPIYRDGDEYYASKPSELTAEQRLAAKLRRATLKQLCKWARRNAERQAACSGIVARGPEGSKVKQKFALLAARHASIAGACYDEIDRREEEVKMRAELKAENV